MGILDRFRKGKSRIPNKKQAPQVLFNKVQDYQGRSNRKYKDYAKEGYQENAICYKDDLIHYNLAWNISIR